MTAKEEVLETIRLWMSAQDRMLDDVTWDQEAVEGYAYALQDLTELLDSL